MYKKVIPLLLIFIVGLTSCTLQKNQEKTSCTKPPESFTSADLIGTWMAKRGNNTDTLIIGADNRYRQIIHIDSPLMDLQTEWFNWHVETNENRLPYLYLDKLHLCVYAPDQFDCSSEGGGDRPWYDYCNQTTASMSDQGTLIVTGVPAEFKQPPGGIVLTLYGLLVDEPWVYQKVEP